MAIGLVSTGVHAGGNMQWPNLPTTGFVVGRPATIEDAKNGNAAFSMEGKSKGALPLVIPQYVQWTDENGEKHTMVLIQAEIAPDNTEIVGLRDFQGHETVATLPEITLLGTEKPN